MSFKPGDKVRVVKAEEDYYWYSKNIGEVFTLKCRDFVDKKRSLWELEDYTSGWRLVEGDFVHASKLDKVLE